MKPTIERIVASTAEEIMAIISNLSAVLVEENGFLQAANDTKLCDHEKLVIRKQQLSDAYYNACKALHAQPLDVRQAMESYFLAQQEELDQFVALLNLNKDLLAARHDRSEKRIEAILSAIKEEEVPAPGYHAKGRPNTADGNAANLRDLQA